MHSHHTDNEHALELQDTLEKCAKHCDVGLSHIVPEVQDWST